MVLSERHKRYIRYAIRVSGDAPLQRYRLGCVIVKNGSPISCGVNNMNKTHPKAIDYQYPYLHAELAAMIGVDERELAGSIAYVARRTSLTIGLAKPCPFCLEQMRRVGIKGVFYTTSGGGAEYIDLR